MNPLEFTLPSFSVTIISSPSLKNISFYLIY